MNPYELSNKLLQAIQDNNFQNVIHYVEKGATIPDDSLKTMELTVSIAFSSNNFSILNYIQENCLLSQNILNHIQNQIRLEKIKQLDLNCPSA